MTMQEKQNNTKTVAKLAVFGVCMFVFAIWVMPPLYTLFCEVTGINGKTKGKYEAVAAEVDTSRTVSVKFVASNNEGMPWEFAPETFTMKVHPGEAITTNFIAKNLTENIMVGQAVPSMVPNNATDYFHKTECFCFNRQALAPGEEAKLGLQFIVDQELPRAIHTIILSYSLFDVTEISPDDVESKKQQIQTSQLEQQNHSSLLTAHTN
ncbi:Cytochrome c oxidase assembly protein CtaG [Thalassocella blandensis]|nr:Cytochrome c oxidase assembly protein CtaG [Thalassocella blandensis]